MKRETILMTGQVVKPGLDPVLRRCSRCPALRDTTGRYCRACRAAYMRTVHRPREKRTASALKLILASLAGNIEKRAQACAVVTVDCAPGQRGGAVKLVERG